MNAQPDIDYDRLAQNALRGVVRDVLLLIERDGLPGEHHFYIAFDTNAEGVSISSRLKSDYPEEMTIVLQHRFWDLMVRADDFEVKLTFNNIPERLCVPFKAIKFFFDPSVPYGLQFEASEMMGDPTRAGGQMSSLVTPDTAGQGAVPGSVDAADVVGADDGKRGQLAAFPSRLRADDAPGDSDAMETVASDAQSPSDPTTSDDAPDSDSSSDEAGDDKGAATVVQLDAFRTKK